MGWCWLRWNWAWRSCWSNEWRLVVDALLVGRVPIPPRTDAALEGARYLRAVMEVATVLLDKARGGCGGCVDVFTNKGGEMTGPAAEHSLSDGHRRLGQLRSYASRVDSVRVEDSGGSVDGGAPAGLDRLLGEMGVAGGEVEIGMRGYR